MIRTGMNKRRKIVVTSSHPGGINAIMPVIKRLTVEKKADIVVIGHKYSEKILQKNGIDYKTIDSYSLKDVSVNSMRHLLKIESPDLVLTGTSYQDEENKDLIEQTIILAAKEENIKSLAVLDFWNIYSMKFSDIYTGEKFKFLPNKIAIMDLIAEQDMVTEGFNKKRLVVTGNPHFDHLSQKAQDFTKKDGQFIREKIGLSSGFLIFYAGSIFKKEKETFGYWDLDVISLINETVKSLPLKQRKQIELIVKLHPRTPQPDVLEIKRYISKYSFDRMKLVAKIDTQELVLASDLILISVSTVGIEAIYMRKPCISLQPGLKGKDFLMIGGESLIPTGYTVDSCQRKLKRAIIDKEYREKEILGGMDDFKTENRATERVVKVIYKMLT